MPNLFPKLLLPLALLATAQPVLAQHASPTRPAHAALRTLSGRVADAQGLPLPGVTVLLKGTHTGTSTDAAGRYTLAGVPARAVVLVFRFVGYAVLERTVPAGTTTVEVVLREDHQALNEVVITGCGTQQRSSVSGSVATVTAAPLMQQVQGRAAFRPQSQAGAPG